VACRRRSRVGMLERICWFGIRAVVGEVQGAVVFDAVWRGPEEKGREVLVKHDWVMFCREFEGCCCVPVCCRGLAGRWRGSQVRSRRKVVSRSCDNSMCPGIDKEGVERKISSMT
jgi:hypothetical protein